jgi:hypothetical protein
MPEPASNFTKAGFMAAVERAKELGKELAKTKKQAQ